MPAASHGSVTHSAEGCDEDRVLADVVGEFAGVALGDEVKSGGVFVDFVSPRCNEGFVVNEHEEGFCRVILRVALVLSEFAHDGEAGQGFSCADV